MKEVVKIRMLSTEVFGLGFSILYLMADEIKHEP